MNKEKTWNPKKHKEQRRKRASKKDIYSTHYVPIVTKSRGGVEHTHYKLVLPIPSTGYNRATRLANRSKFKHGN